MAKSGSVYLLVRKLKTKTNTSVNLFKEVCNGSHSLSFCVPRLKQWLRDVGHEDLANSIPDYRKRGEPGYPEWQRFAKSELEQPEATGMAMNDDGSIQVSGGDGSIQVGGGDASIQVWGGGGSIHAAGGIESIRVAGDDGSIQGGDGGDGSIRVGGGDGSIHGGTHGPSCPAHRVVKRPLESNDESPPRKLLQTAIGTLQHDLALFEHVLYNTPAISPEERVWGELMCKRAKQFAADLSARELEVSSAELELLTEVMPDDLNRDERVE